MVSAINNSPEITVYGEVSAVRGLVIHVVGITQALSIGDYCTVQARDGRQIFCEVVGFDKEKALAVPFGTVEGVSAGARVTFSGAKPAIYPSPGWLGRAINALGEPIDGLGPLPQGNKPYYIRANPPPAYNRGRVEGKVDIGVRSLNTFTTLCRGQRIGIFSGSGVGKSSLIGMIARNTVTPVTVLGLVGERGREAREFIEDDLGPEGMKRAILVLSTSDESPLLRRQCPYTAMAVAEYFRDTAQDVLVMMDSITRFAMASREIGLSAGEPVTSKGYTPMVFSEMPKLLERAGMGTDGRGSITGIFTVLVEGDDLTEPISDAARGILDGHIVLDRAIADRNRYPAVNALRSISRMMPACNTEAQNALVNRARQLMSAYDNMAELIRLGAYKAGSNPEVDEAISYHPKLEAFMAQRKDEKADLESGYRQLAEILGMEYGQADENVKDPD